jgi:hypothetical protein
MGRLALSICALGFFAAGCGDTTSQTGADLAVSTPPDLATGSIPDMTMVDFGPITAKTYHVTLTPGAEVPTCAAGAGDTGSATVAIDAKNTMIAVTNFTYKISKPSGAITMAHIHWGATGISGGVAFDFGSPPPASPFNKTFAAADYKMPAGAPATFDGFMADLRAGKAYINVHTTNCGNGSIRGQIQ